MLLIYYETTVDIVHVCYIVYMYCITIDMHAASSKHEYSIKINFTKEINPQIRDFLDSCEPLA